MAVLEVLSGFGVAAEVLVGRRVLEAVLSTQHTSAGLASVWPSAVLLGVITAVLGLAGVGAGVLPLRGHHDAEGPGAELPG